MEKSTLCFFTNSYPFGRGEPFIENELNYIAPLYDVVYLFHKSNAGDVREVPANVKLIYIDKPINIPKSSIVRGNFFILCNIVIRELFFSRQKKLFIKNFKYNLSHLVNCIYYSTEIKKRLDYKTLTHAYFYSYWFFDWNLSLSILKFKNVINKNFTRTHGFDLYENNGKPNYLPARKFSLNNTDKVFAISHVGENYLKNIYPQFKNKIHCSYLGTKDFGSNPLPDMNSPIHIVSCSNLNKVKRVHLIIDILKCIKVPILWTHIGDGELLEEIENKTKDLPINVTIDFKGRQSQKEIFDFYSKVPIDIFINCSISEGLPVSIMEAISFGIPVIATDVGGTREIVTLKSGILVEKEFSGKIVAEEIVKLKNMKNSEEYRNQVKQFWKNNFLADVNYSLFANFLRV